MLYDLRREAWSEPWFRGILAEAADYIEQHGWCQGRYANRKGEVCLIGALRKVGKAHGYGQAAFVLELELKGLMVSRGQMTAWNDRVARSKDQVVARLRWCAEH